MRRNQSEIATQAIIFLGGRPEDLAHLFAVTGVDPTDVRERLNDAGFQAGILDYLVSNEPLLLAFCEESGHDPHVVAGLAAQTGGWM